MEDSAHEFVSDFHAGDKDYSIGKVFKAVVSEGFDYQWMVSVACMIWEENDAFPFVDTFSD